MDTPLDEVAFDFNLDLLAASALPKIDAFRGISVYGVFMWNGAHIGRTRVQPPTDSPQWWRTEPEPKSFSSKPSSKTNGKKPTKRRGHVHGHVSWKVSLFKPARVRLADCGFEVLVYNKLKPKDDFPHKPKFEAAEGDPLIGSIKLSGIQLLGLWYATLIFCHNPHLSTLLCALFSLLLFISNSVLNKCGDPNPDPHPDPRARPCAVATLTKKLSLQHRLRCWARRTHSGSGRADSSPCARAPSALVK